MDDQMEEWKMKEQAMSTKSPAWTWIKNAFGPDYRRYEGVYKINIYLLRLLYIPATLRNAG